jgi:predicted extracellular nuclease
VTSALVLGVASLMAPAAHASCAVPGMTAIHSLFTTGAHRVRVRGIVTARFPGLHGYFLESPRKRWDDDPQTSEGIFVYIGHHKSAVSRGDRVVLAGHPKNFHGMPEITHAKVLKHCASAALPPAVTLLPALYAVGRERFLGMRVSFTRPVVVTGLADLGRYGEVRVAAGSRPRAPTALTAPGPAVWSLKGKQSALSFWLDDGTTQSHPSHWRLGGHTIDADDPLRAGQKLIDLQGIAYHAFGRGLIEATGFKLDRAANPRRMPAALDWLAGPRVVSFNVENYFNRAFRGKRFPTERGARKLKGFRCQRDKLVAALAALHPALAGLQEIENNGTGSRGALSNLVSALNEAVGKADYQFIESPDKRLGDDLIAPALVYDSSKLRVVGERAVLQPDSLPRAARLGLSRPALAASFRLRGSDLIFTAVVVHLRSKLTACHHDLDSKAGAGHCALARAAAIRHLEHWIAATPTGAGGKRVMLLGDFNTYPKERAITELIKAGWHDLAARYVPARERYTEVYQGRNGELDYAFVSTALARHVAGAAIWHNDADEARALGYAGAMAHCSGKPTPWRASDHDPVVVVLKP